MDSDSGGEKRLISVRARGGEINECRDVICNICMVGSSYWGCDYEKTTTRNMDIISGLGCSRMYLTLHYMWVPMNLGCDRFNNGSSFFPFILKHKLISRYHIAS